MKIAIVGYATEGEVSARYWAAKGDEVTVCDQNESLPVPSDYQAVLGPNYLDNLDRFDVIVRSAGIHPRVILDKNPGVADKITTNIEEFMKVCPTKNTIGVTGTKGKGTTSMLIHKMLSGAGLKSHIGGNIGIPPLELLGQISPTDWVVLELSSFQLEDFKGPSPHIGVCIMVVPEHLNWHANMDEYLTAKGQLFSHQTSNDIAIYYGQNENSKLIASKSAGRLIPYLENPGAVVDDGVVKIDGQEICPVGELALPGKHNWQNICAAVTAVWQISQDISAIKSVLTSFSGLEHRLEFVREFQDIKYYDDSFATTPETAIAAMEAFESPKVLILGGSDKGIPLDPMAAAVPKNNVRHVVAIGDMGETIKNLLLAQGFDGITTGPGTMPEIIAAAKQHAQPGDIVLLSTGCASFGLFKDYKDRGNQFKQVVQSLA